MSRVSYIPENNFSATVQELLDEINYLKNRQIIGSSSLVLNATLAPTGSSGWDIHIPANAYAQKIITIEFAPDSKRPVYAELGYAKHVAFSSGYEVIELYPDPAGQGLPNGRQRWKLIFTNDSNNTDIYINLGIKSTDTGAITWTITDGTF